MGELCIFYRYDSTELYKQNLLYFIKTNLFEISCSFCAQIASGLRHCHQNLIVHGDVKPANVMVSPMGICKLGDFGNSIKLDVNATGSQHTRPAEDIVGTAAYAAPEIIRGLCSTPSSDMYSFGILLWQMETREMPFAGEHPHVIMYKVTCFFAFQNVRFKSFQITQ